MTARAGLWLQQGAAPQDAAWDVPPRAEEDRVPLFVVESGCGYRARGWCRQGTSSLQGDAVTGRLEGKVAIVTGGASGMGLGTVERFLAEGARVVVGDLNAAKGEELTAACAARGQADRVRFTRTDVSLEEDVAALVSLAVEAFGGLDVMFNNAGIGGAFGPITELDADAWDETFDIDVRSVFLGIKHAARVMLEAGQGGSIINTASVAGLTSGAGPTAYGAAKSAVASLSQAAALELAPHRIRVNAICPGVIYTPLMHQGDEAAADEWVSALQPWPERGEPAHIAGAALWLASDDSTFVTGQNIVVDGGLLAAGPRVTQFSHMFKDLNKLVGFAYGTTGQKPRFRRL
ncbi:MAG: glucose 1-dehydrogenase [Acidimicrobiia bacterium]|nr:glucose 1-dehydrogenase [Acidimicrobiia bacterium]